eukprot:TRINITY_DN3099_c3_g1_i1.p1 TRINITY_DN3099_c3_g1~~TRINITY_DN3099_c3_g1_i1.p1  ORF type:complete len:184 (+),score=64.93 TRINITY_DN3099_c3_g1_i1:916-1467(+)
MAHDHGKPPSENPYAAVSQVETRPSESPARAAAAAAPVSAADDAPTAPPAASTSTTAASASTTAAAAPAATAAPSLTSPESLDRDYAYAVAVSESPPRIMRGVPVVVQPPSAATTVFVVTEAATCRYCGHTGPLVTQSVGPGFSAWCWCMVLFFLFWPLCWLPFVMDSCMEQEIICANCRRPL